MRKKILAIDTTMLCVWLKIPHKDTCSIDGKTWDHGEVEHLIKEEKKKGSLLLLPVATLIETGNHIAQIKSPYSAQRYPLAQKLGSIIIDTTREGSQWIAFTQQEVLWSDTALRKLAEEWPRLAAE